MNATWQYIVLIIALGLVLDWAVIIWARDRRHTKTGNIPDGKEVRFLGFYSPILTWIKYRRFTGRIEKNIPATLPNITTSLTASTVIRNIDIPEEFDRMSVPEISASPVSASESAPAAMPAPTEAAPVETVKASPFTLDREAQWHLAVAIAVAVLALIGQFYWSHIEEDTWDAVVFFGAAIILFWILIWRTETPLVDVPGLKMRLQNGISVLRNEPIRTVLMVVCLALTYTTVRLFFSKVGTDSYLDVFVLWLISGLSYAAAFAHLPQVNIKAWLRTNQLELAAVAGLTIVAALLRFIGLGAQPDIVSGDEGIIGMIAMSVVRGEVTNLFIPVINQGIMYMETLAATINIFGHNALGLRFMAALGGTLSVPALYLLGRQMFGWRVGFIAAALLAVSHFHLQFSRVIVATGIQDAFFTIVVFYLLMLGLQRRSTIIIVAAGLVLGLHAYVYMGARLIILLVPIYLLAVWIVDRQTIRQNAGNLLAGLGALAIFLAPLAAWSIKYPDEFMSRANQMGIIQSGWLANEVAITGKNVVVIMAELIKQAFLTINYYPAAVHYNSKHPMLDFVSAAMFMVGLAYAFYRVTDRRYLLLHAWMWSGLVVGGALVLIPSDNGYRILIIFPAVCLLVGIGVDRLIALVSKSFSSDLFRRLQWIPIGLFVVSAAYLNYQAYFVEFLPNCQYGNWTTRFSSFQGDKLREVGPEYSAYTVGNSDLYHGIYQSVDYLSGSIPVIDVAPVEGTTSSTGFQDRDGNPLDLTKNANSIFFFTEERANEVERVKDVLPGGTVSVKSDCGEPIMTVYQVDGS